MQDRRSPTWYLVSIALLGTGLSGCAFIPTPVRLLNKPHVTEKQLDRDVKLCVIVRDERPHAIRESNMCGLMRNLYMMPTSFAFITHREHLDEIMAHHIKRNFEHLGYTVVAAYPKPPSELSPEELKAKELDQEARKTAWWKDRKSQEDPESKRTGLKGGVEELDEEYVSAWGPEVDTAGADAVVEVKVRKFWSDMGWGIDVGGVFAWMSANLAVCDPDDPDRRVVFGKKVRGFGHGRGLTPIEAYGVPVNTAYWFVLHEIEKTVASEEFQKAVAEVRTARVRGTQ
jgi:hypothetical protein